MQRSPSLSPFILYLDPFFSTLTTVFLGSISNFISGLILFHIFSNFCHKDNDDSFLPLKLSVATAMMSFTKSVINFVKVFEKSFSIWNGCKAIVLYLRSTSFKS